MPSPFCGWQQPTSSDSQTEDSRYCTHATAHKRCTGEILSLSHTRGAHHHISHQAKVYLLVRGKRSTSAAARVEKMLCGPLFNLLHKEAASGQRQVFHRVKVIEGDLAGLGLQPSDRQLLVEEIDTVIHCAANLTLDAHIQDTIK